MRRGSTNLNSLSLADDAEYAVLSAMAHPSLQSNSHFEAAMGFLGSTFQVPESGLNDDLREMSGYGDIILTADAQNVLTTELI